MITLKGTISDTVKQMILALPGFDMGNKTHNFYVNKIEGALPGHFSQLIGKGKSFRKIFFSKWKAAALYNEVEGFTGLNNSWWSGFAVALLCQSMDHVTHRLKKQLKSGDINNAVNSHNRKLHASSARFYSLVLSKYFAPFSSLMSRINHNTAKKEYHDGLIENVFTHQLWYTSNAWKNPDWELFHHYAKLIALGSSFSDINTLIGELREAGLPIPQSVDEKHWRSYTVYLHNNPTIDHGDIDSSASKAILESTILPSFGGGIPASMPEGNSFEFTANSQPGNKFRHKPKSGSCFSADTLVLMADGTTSPINTIKAGDKVLSFDGPSEVAFISTPLLAGRQLYSINSLAFSFTETHPFLNGNKSSGAPRFLSVNPEKLNQTVPTLNREGVAPLNKGAILESVKPQTPNQWELLTIESVKEEDEASSPFVYDLILKPKKNRFPGFFAGDGKLFFPVLPEMPLLPKAPFAVMIILKLLSQNAMELAGFFNNIQGKNLEEKIDNFYRYLNEFYHINSADLLAKASHKIPKTELPALPQKTPGSPAMQISAYLNSLKEIPPEANAPFGLVFEALSSHLIDELETAVRLGWRVFPEEAGNVMALSFEGLYLDSPAPEEQPLRLVIKYYEEELFIEEFTLYDNQGRDNSRFTHFFDRVIYLKSAHLEDQKNRKLQLLVFGEKSTIPVLSTDVGFPENFHGPYYPFESTLRDGWNNKAGAVRFNLRLISKAAQKNETKRAPLWNEAAMIQFSEKLGNEMSLELARKITVLKESNEPFKAHFF